MANFKEILAGDKPVLVDFFATWCGPCKMMHPILEELAKITDGSCRILKVDIDLAANKAFVTEHNIRSVPTLMIFKEGKPVWRQSGVVSARQLKETLESV